MSNFAVSKKILKWAIERKGLTAKDLSKKFAKIDAWLRGESQPTIRQLEAFAKATSTPFGYFFLKEPPTITLSIPHYRTVDDGKPYSASPDLIDTVNQMQLRQDWIKDFLIQQGNEKCSFVGSIKTDENIVRAAETIRSTLNLKFNWASAYDNFTDTLRGLRNSMEDVGILVFINGVVGNNTTRVLNPNEFRGFVLCDYYAPLVFVNGSDAKAAQIFTLAHELAHIFLGSSASFDLRDLHSSNNPTERQCNAVAAELLVPQEQLSNLWKTEKNKTDPYSNLSKLFKVSSIVVARRALDLRLISKNDFFNFYNSYLTQFAEAKKSNKSTGGDFYASQSLRVGRTFGEIVVKAVREGTLLYTDAYRLTGLNGNSFQEFASQRGLKKTGSG